MNINVLTTDSEEFRNLLSSIEQIKSEVSKINTSGKNPKWITKKQVMEILNISPKTLQNYRDNGKLPFSKIGKKIQYKLSDVEELLNKNYFNQFKK